LMALELPVNNTVPLLVLVGEKETGAAKSAARQLFAAIPGVQAAIVPDVAHVWNLQKPDLFCDVVSQWATQKKIHGSLRSF